MIASRTTFGDFLTQEVIASMMAGRSHLGRAAVALATGALIFLVALMDSSTRWTELPQVNGVNYPDYMPWYSPDAIQPRQPLRRAIC